MWGICRWAKSEKVGAISNSGKGRPVRFFFFLQGETVLVVQLLQQCEIVISLKLRKGNPADQRTSGVLSRFLVHHWCGRLDGEHVVLLIRGGEGDGAGLKVQSKTQEIQGGFCLQNDVSSVEVFVTQDVGCRSRKPSRSCDHEPVVHIAEQEGVLKGARSRSRMGVGPNLLGDRNYHQA